MAKKPDTAPKAGDNASATASDADVSGANTALAQAANAGTASRSREPIDKTERRYFIAASNVLHDGESYVAGDSLPLTRTDFDQLKPSGAIEAAEWTTRRSWTSDPFSRGSAAR